MFETKKQLTIALVVLFIFAVGTLVLTIGGFAGGDFSPHPIYSHVHRRYTSNAGVDWIVEVGRLEWNNVSTYSWHRVYVKNDTSESVTGEWEWKHYVRNESGGWSKTDKIQQTINLRANRLGDQVLSRYGWVSIDLPPGVDKYRIEAYTRVSLVKEGISLTAGGLGQRDIMSEWFTIGN